MRKAPLAAWLACVIALGATLASPHVAAQKKSTKRVRAISACVKYDRSQADDGLTLSLDNTCNLDVECSMKWTLRCDEGPRHAGSTTLEIARGTESTAFASADQCGEDGWRITGIKWSCRGAGD